MKPTKNRIFGILLGLALVLGMMPVPGMKAHAIDPREHWSTNQSITEDTEITYGVTLDESITLTIADGKTLTVNGGLWSDNLMSLCTLTVTGKGSLKINGPQNSIAFGGNMIVDGADVEITGGNGLDDQTSEGGRAGGWGVYGDITVNSGSAKVTGGNGGNGSGGSVGGDGGFGIRGNLTVTSGEAHVSGGDGGSGGNDGNPAKAVYGTLSGEGFEESDDNAAWTAVSGNASEKQYVRTVTPPVNVKIDVGAGHAGLFTADVLSGLVTETDAITATINGNIITLTVDAGTMQNELRGSIDDYLYQLIGDDQYWLIHNKECFRYTGYKKFDEYLSKDDLDDDIVYAKHKVPVTDDMTYYLLWQKPYTDIKLDNGNPVCGKQADDSMPKPPAGTIMTRGFSFWKDAEDHFAYTFKGGEEYTCHAAIQIDPKGDYWRYFIDKDNLNVSVKGGKDVRIDDSLPGMPIIIFKVTADHDWDEGKVTKEPTTTAEGEKLFTCKVKDCGATKTEVVPKLKPIALMAKGTAKGKTSVRLSWNKVAGTATYEVWMVKCSRQKMKKVKTLQVPKNSWTKTKLKKNTAYKFYVVAKDASGKALKKSLTAHVITGNVKGKYTNAKRLKLTKTSFSLSKGGTARIKATQAKVKKGKRLCKHVKLLRYTSEDPSVATVSSSGKITAVSAGTCKVYVQTVNGIWKAAKVTVK